MLSILRGGEISTRSARGENPTEQQCLYIGVWHGEIS